MIAGVADTHTALWYLFADSRLSSTAKDFINRAAARRQKIAISSISLAEVYKLCLGLIRKGGIGMTRLRRDTGARKGRYRDKLQNSQKSYIQ